MEDVSFQRPLKHFPWIPLICFGILLFYPFPPVLVKVLDTVATFKLETILVDNNWTEFVVNVTKSVLSFQFYFLSVFFLLAFTPSFDWYQELLTCFDNSVTNYQILISTL